MKIALQHGIMYRFLFVQMYLHHGIINLLVLKISKVLFIPFHDVTRNSCKILYAVKYSETELIFSYGLLYLCTISNHLMNRKCSYANATRHNLSTTKNETLIKMSWC
jgi:hypothetical protein